MGSAGYFCDILLFIPFCKPFCCIQCRKDLQIPCLSRTFGRSNNVLSSFRHSHIPGYLQGFITAFPKLWHCSSADDLHAYLCWLLSVPLHNSSNQKVKHCLTILHHFRGTRNQNIAPCVGRMSMPRKTQLLRNSQSDRHSHREDFCWYPVTEVIRKSKGWFLHVCLCRFPLSRNAC